MLSTPVNTPRIVFAGLSGGAGKTILSLGVTRALVRRGLKVRPFKKGPDYIDATWLGLAAQATPCNLDPYFLSPDVLRALFCEKAQGADISVIEGNRGLFDGKDVDGSCSTAQLARELSAPVVLAVDATKMTRTAAAVVQGCAGFEPGLNLAGVVFNRTAGERHRSMLLQAMEQYTDIPVLGMLPKIRHNPIPERHMGLVSNQEYEGESHALDKLADLADEWLDLKRMQQLAEAAPAIHCGQPVPWPKPVTTARPVIGYVHDAALWFYYQENIEALEKAGAKVVRLSLLDNEPWPEIHGLYLGGGFPETLARELSANTPAKARVRQLAEDDLPIYAECGGFMYLGRSVEYEGASYPLSGVLDLTTHLCERPQGLGYTRAKATRENLYHPVGEIILGHEFHYSMCVQGEDSGLVFGVDMERGSGVSSGKDGILHRNVFAGYNHIHALGTPHWAPNFVRAAARYQAEKASPKHAS